MKKDDVILLIDFIEIHEEGHSMAYIQYLKDLVYSSKDGSCLENNKPFAIPDVSVTVCDCPEADRMHLMGDEPDECTKCGKKFYAH